MFVFNTYDVINFLYDVISFSLTSSVFLTPSVQSYFSPSSSACCCCCCSSSSCTSSSTSTFTSSTSSSTSRPIPNCFVISIVLPLSLPHIQELWALLHFADKVKFANQKEFLDQFRDLKDATQVAKLHTMLKPYLLRR